MKSKFFCKMKFSGFFILLLFVLTLTASAQAETVATIGTTNYETLQAAIEAANDGATITLTSDYYNSTGNYTIDKNISLDLAGHTASLRLIETTKSLTIQNGTLSCMLRGTGSDSALTLDNATLNCKRITQTTDYLGIYWMAKNVSLVNKSTLSIEDDDGEYAYYDGAAFNGNLNLTLDNTSLIILKRAALNNNANVKSQFSKYLPSGYTLVESSNIDESKPLVVSHNNLEYQNTVILSAKTDANVSKDVKDPVTTSDSNGSHTKRVTVFGKNVGSGTKIFASADISISAASENFSVEKNSELVIPVSVDVNILNDDWIQAVTGGSVKLTITSGPSWLHISDSNSATRTLDGKTKTLTFVLSGTPTSTAENRSLNITANVTLTGDTTLTASCYKSVSVNVTAVSTPSTKTVKEVTVDLQPTSSLSLMQGETQSVTFRAGAMVHYSNGTGESLTPTYTLESNYEWIKIDPSTGTVTASPTKDVSAGDYSVKIIASATADGVTQTAETTLTVTVVTATASVPKNLTVDKSSITIDIDVEKDTSVSDSVNVTVKDTNGNDITALGEIVCEKTTPDVDGLTSTVDGNKITFTALAENVSGTNTAVFVVSFMYNGKDYLKTSYKVELYVTRVGGYYLTLSPVEITVIPGRTASLDLKNSVKFEKVFQNNHRQTVEDAKMKFSLPSGAASWTNCDPDSGVVTLNPGADVENGTLKYSYKVKAEYDGNSETDAADFKVNVVKKSPAITTETIPNATVNTPYSHTFMATGDDPITWSITNFESHPFPDWLTIDAGTGTISGTPASEGLFSFTVQASNAYGTDSCGFSIEVTKDVLPASWKYSLDPSAGHYLKSGQTFYYKRRVAKGGNISYTYKEKAIPRGKNLKSVFVYDKADGAVKEGASYIKFTLRYMGTTHDYVFSEYAITAHNGYGKSYAPEKTITVTKNEKNTNGKISLSAQGAEDGLITLADDEDGGEELSGSMYFDDGGTDEDGNITGVIGGENAKFKTLADFIKSLTEEQCAKVIRIEFRKGAEVSTITATDLADFTGLLEIAVDESETLTEFNLNGNKTIESVSIFKCSALKKLDVKNCTALYHLEAAQCPKLTALDVEGCSRLEAIWLNGSSVTNLNLSGSEFANIADIDLTECNSLTSLNVDGCAALSNLYAPYTAVTELNLKNNLELTDVFLNETKVGTLDLSNNAKLKSLSLVGATELADLKLAEGVELEEFEVTGSKITGITLAGYNSAELALSNNTAMTSLALKDSPLVETIRLNGCAKLASLTLDGCPNVKEIYLNGTAITALSLNGYEKLTSLDVSSCASLTALDVSGSALRYLEVSGCSSLASLNCSENSLGYLKLDGLNSLSEVICAGQTIGDWTPTTSLDMTLYAGDDMSRISGFYGYDSNNAIIEPAWDEQTGVAEFDLVPSRVEYLYATNYGDLKMDVTLASGSVERDGANGSGGGCGSGFSAVSGLLALIPLLWLPNNKKKEK